MIKYFSSKIILGILIIPSFYLSAILYAKDLGNAFDPTVKFQRYSSEHGLSQTTINTMVQDPAGYIWLGTQDGLNRFDGYEFKVIKRGLKDTSLPDNWINDLLIVDDKTMWVATELGGLSIYDASEESFRRVVSVREDHTTPSSNKVIRLYKDLEQNIWLATSRGLNRFDSNTNQFVRLEDRFPQLNSRVYDLVMDSAHHLWIATSTGLYFVSQNFTEIEKIILPAKSGEPRLDRKALQLGNGDLLWVATHSGLYQIDTRSRDVSIIDNMLIDNKALSEYQINDIAISEKGAIWIALINGICQLDFSNSQSTCYKSESSNPDSLPSKNIKTLFIDRQSQLWVGGSDSGFAILKKGNPGIVTLRQSGGDGINLAGPGVRAVLKDSDGNIWIGHKNSGITLINRKRNEIRYLNATSKNHALKSNQIRSLYEGDEKIFIGYLNNWFSILDKTTGEIKHVNLVRKSETNTHKPTTVYDFARIDRGDYLIATSSAGLFRYDLEKGQTANYMPGGGKSIIGRRVQDIFVDDHIWLATTKGLSKFDPKTEIFINYVNNIDPNLSAANRFYSIDKTSDGKYWLGTRAGLFNFDPKTHQFQSFRKKYSKTNDTVYAALADANDNIWISTNNGLAALDAKTHQYSMFYKDDGIQNNEFSAYAFFKDKTQNLYFGGIDGLTIIRPDRISRHNPQVQSHITEFRLFNQAVPTQKIDNRSPLINGIGFTNSLYLKNNQSYFSFVMSALQYQSPNKVEYAYRFKGMFDKWVVLDSGNRQVVFTHVPPGDYVFEHRARFPDSSWPEKYGRINIRVEPSVWLSWWAKSAYLILALFVIFIFVLWQRQRFRVRQLLSEKQLAEMASKSKSRFLAVMSHEIRTPLNGVLGMLELLKKTSLAEDQTHYLQVAERSGASLLGLVNEILDYSKIEAGKMELVEDVFNLKALIHETIQIFAGVIQASSINMIASVDPEIPPLLYGDANRLKQVLVNLIGNAVKFTEKGHIALSVHISCTEMHSEGGNQINGVIQIAFVVSDSGIGISKEKQDQIFDNFTQVDQRTNRNYGGTGLGLTISRKLVQLLGGSLTLQSQEGVGSSFRFEIGLKRQSKSMKGDGVHPGKKNISCVDSLDGEYLPVFYPGEVRVLVVINDSWAGEFIKIGLERYYVRVDYFSVAEVELLSSAVIGARNYTLAFVFQDGDIEKTNQAIGRLEAFMDIIAVGWEHLTEISTLAEKIKANIFQPIDLTDVLWIIENNLSENSEKPKMIRENRLTESSSTKAGRTESRARRMGDNRDSVPVDIIVNEGAALGKGKILVAEDNEINQLVIKGILNKLGHNPIIVENGQEAVLKHAELGDSCSLILMDCEMPVMDGNTATRQIRQHEQETGANTCPIVALSAHALEEHQAESIQSGMNDYVCKPVNIEKIKNILTQFELEIAS